MPLNDFLYKRLKRAFRAVKVSNPGQKMVAKEGTSMFSSPDGRIKSRLKIEHDGEYYLVCCPYCNDTRFRLYINHCFGQKSNTGRRLNFLAICYNEGCMRHEKNRDDFLEKLQVLDSELEAAPIAKGTVIDPSKLIATMPGPCRRLDKLPRDHYARRYVESRRMDPDLLGRVYKVCYCVDSIYFLACHRLVVPVFWEGRLVGWQCRYVGELPWKDPKKKADLPPKYYTMPNMPRGSILPNLDMAKKYQTGVLVEGWFDVFAFGPMAMPVMGNTVSDQQKRMFSATFGRVGRSGLHMLDPEEFESDGTKRDLKWLNQRMRGQFAAIKLPDGTDPGGLDRSFLRDYAKEHAADQGVKVSYRKV